MSIDSQLHSLHLDNLDWITDSRLCHNLESNEDGSANQETRHHASCQEYKPSRIDSVHSKSNDPVNLRTAKGTESDMKAHTLSSENGTRGDSLITRGDGSSKIINYNRIVSEGAVTNGNVKSSSSSLESSPLVQKSVSEANSVSRIGSVPQKDESLQHMLRRATEQSWRLEKEGLVSSASGTTFRAGPRAEGTDFSDPSANVPPCTTCKQEQHEAVGDRNCLISEISQTYGDFKRLKSDEVRAWENNMSGHVKSVCER